MPNRKLSITELKGLLGKDTPMPRDFDEPLRDAVINFMQYDKVPATERKRFNMVPPNENYRMFPQRAREAWRLATPKAQLVFLALWQAHEDWHAARNGLLFASIGFLQDLTCIGNRNHVQDAIDELACRGLIRVLRGRGGSGGFRSANCFQLTCFPDALGNPATQDYLKLGLPSEKPKSNHALSRQLEYHEIKCRFSQHIKLRVALTKAIRAANRQKNRPSVPI